MAGVADMLSGLADNSQPQDTPPAPNPVLAGRQPGASYNTPLDPGTEQFFRQWVAQNKVPFDVNATGPSDYDMRGFYKAALQGNPKAQTGVDPNDGLMHYNDYWKTPTHETFGQQSQWGPANGPQWNEQDQLIGQNGRIVYDDRARPVRNPQDIRQLAINIGTPN